MYEKFCYHANAKHIHLYVDKFLTRFQLVYALHITQCIDVFVVTQ